MRRRSAETGTTLPLGPASLAMLRRAGITSIEEHRRLGPVAALLAVRQAGARPTLNLLWALEAALTGGSWLDLSEPRKRQLRAELAKAERS